MPPYTGRQKDKERESKAGHWRKQKDKIWTGKRRYSRGRQRKKNKQEME